MQARQKFARWAAFRLLWTGDWAAVYIGLPFWKLLFGEPKIVNSKIKFTGLASIP
jgi:hypothetical protein